MLFETLIWYVLAGTQMPVPASAQMLVSMSKRAQEAIAPSVIYFETFEGPHPFSKAYRLEIGPWSYALQYVNKPEYPDNKCARFEIRKEQPLIENGKRSEATIIKHLPAREMWYAFTVYFPADGFETDTQRELISQWYQNGSPATSLRVRHDLLYLESGNDKNARTEYPIVELKKDKWYDLVFHFVHSPTADGRIEVWLNQTKVLERKGGNMYDDILPKWKVGVYKAAFKKNASIVNKRVVFFDNIKVGNENATLKDMLP